MAIMNNKKVVQKRVNADIIPSDVVNGKRAIHACDDLLLFLQPVLQGTRREGDLEGVAFLAGLMADLSALRDGLDTTVYEQRKQ